MTAFIAYCVSIISRRFNLRPTQVRHYSDAIQPFVKHKTLSYDQFKGRNILIVGDVHGCYDEAMELLAEVEKKHGRNFVTIFVGDMINKGPKNVEMLNFIMKTKNVFCIRGNHEQAVLKTAFQFRTDPSNVNPRWETPWVKNLTNEQFVFLTNLPYTIFIPVLGVIIVHGGLDPRLPLHLQDDHNMLHMRCLEWVKDYFHGQILKPTARHEGHMWATCWRRPEHVYFGHDAISQLQIEDNCTGLDTGCLYGKKLTGVFLEVPKSLAKPIRHFDLKREFFSVNAHDEYVKVD